MTTSRDRLVRGLVVYFACVQLAHLISLGWEGSYFLRTGGFAWLAPPPAGGWSRGAQAALLAMGAADAILVLFSLGFAWGTLTHRRWSRPLGTAVLLAFSITALAFALVTVPSGVWVEHLNYAVEAVLYVPIGLLTYLHLRSGFEARRRGATPGEVGG